MITAMTSDCLDTLKERRKNSMLVVFLCLTQIIIIPSIRCCTPQTGSHLQQHRLPTGTGTERGEVGEYGLALADDLADVSSTSALSY